MQSIEDLSIPAIDGMRHLVVSEDVVTAVAFAVSRDHDVRTAYRFVTALVMTDRLEDRRTWRPVLAWVKRLEQDAR